MNKKKILFLITKGNWGGAQKYVYELANALKDDKDFDISVAFGGSGILKDRLEEIGIKIHILKTLENNVSFFQVFSNLKEIINLIKKEKPDILHLNSSKAGYFGAFCGRFFSDTKIIFTSHGWPFNENRNLLVKLFFWELMVVTVLLSHKIIAVSKKIEQETPLYPFVKNKIVQIYFGIPNCELLDREEARKKLDLDVPNRIDIVTMAELNENKGHRYSLAAIKNLIYVDNLKIHYHIFGGGKDEEKIKNIIKKSNLEAYVTLHGFVKNSYTYLKAFDVFLLSSVTEALGLVLLEAGYAGLPVVATNVGGIPEVIEDKVTGLLAKSKDAKDIKDKLYKIIKDEVLRKNLANNLNKKVSEKFMFAVTVQKTKELYRDLLA